MKSVDRVLAALRLKEPDVVPIGEQSYDIIKISEALGKPVSSPSPSIDKRMATVRRNVESLSRFIEKLDLDLVPVKPSPPIGEVKIKWIDKDTWIDEWGAKYRFRDGINWYVGPALSDIHMIDILEPPDPHATGITDEAELIVKRFKGKRAIVGSLPGEKIPYLSRGIDGYIMDLYRHFPMAKKFMEMATEYNVEVGKRLIEAGVDLVCVSGDIAYKGGPIVSVKHFREVFVPSIRRIVEEFHRLSVPVVKHSDGNLEPILDDLVATGIDGLQSIEPAAGMDIGKVKARYGDKICLWGNIDLSYTLALGTEEEVTEEVKRCILAAAPGGGFILSSSNSYSSAIKFENFQAMIRAGRKYGKYPIKV
jgi:uroporphyrinogen decarboxylase